MSPHEYVWRKLPTDDHQGFVEVVRAHPVNPHEYVQLPTGDHQGHVEVVRAKLAFKGLTGLHGKARETRTSSLPPCPLEA